MPSITQKVERLDHRTDAILASFDSHLSTVLSRSQVRLALQLRSRLDFEPEGMLRPTAANLRILKQIPAIFRQTLETEGYDALVVSFLASFDGGLPVFESILSDVTKGYQIPPVDYTKADQAYFTQLKQGVALNLEDSISQAANSARRTTLFSVGGVPFEKLAVELAERLHTTLGLASTTAATGISTFYRTVAERGFKKIEDELLPLGRTLEYTYIGPRDKLTRPFCSRLTGEAASGRTWTRGQIGRMDNGQLPDVFRTGGGYNCRHQFIVALDA